MTITIALTRGQVALIDDEDADLGNLRWYASPAHYKRSTTSYYAMRGKEGTSLHRLILARILGRELELGEIVDHINNNTLDNRRSNLRVATMSQSNANRRRNRNNTSGYKGVHFYKQYKKWSASLMVMGKRKHLGYFDTAELAHAAYCAAAVKYHGEFARFE